MNPHAGDAGVGDGGTVSTTSYPVTWEERGAAPLEGRLELAAGAIAFEGLDEQNRPVCPGTRGEIVARGPNVMKGYWNRPEATSEVIDPEGWFHTGDIGMQDNEGYFYVLDRKKDMVITGGENVYPAEVEAVLYQMPGIAEAGVIGLPDERWGERVVAVVVAAPGVSLTAEQVIAFTEGRLARYKMPRQVEFVGSLPRNPQGKLLKRVLREMFAPARAVSAHR